MKHSTIWHITILTVALAMLGLTGCQAPPEDTRAYWSQRIDRLEETVEPVAVQIQTLEQTLQQFADQLAAAGPGDPRIDRLRREAEAGAGVLGELLGRRDQLTAQIVQANATLAAIPDDATSAEINARMGGQAVAGVGAFLPPPWNAIAVGIGGLIGGSGGLFGLIGRRRAQNAEAKAAQTSEAFESTVAAIENAKRTNMKLREGFADASGDIRVHMSNQAEQRVNEIRTLYGKA